VIALLTRLLAVFLVLSSTGVLPAAARFAHADCEECTRPQAGNSEAGESDCTDCPADCAVCICCPLRAAAAAQPTGFVPLPINPQRVAAAEARAALPGITSDIFHPPRA